MLTRPPLVLHRRFFGSTQATNQLRLREQLIRDVTRLSGFQLHGVPFFKREAFEAEVLQQWSTEKLEQYRGFMQAFTDGMIKINGEDEYTTARMLHTFKSSSGKFKH